MADDIVIHVVDDDDAVRESLRFLLGINGFRVRGWKSGTTLLAALPLPGPGCIVLDVRMPDLDGVTVLRRLRERGSQLPVIVITGHADVPLAVRAMKAGADDFREKPYTEQEILESIRTALVRNRAPGPAVPPDLAARLAALTPREREVLHGLVAGLPNKSIGYDLGISPRTVEIHRARVMDKMSARSLSELVRLSLAAGVIPGVA
jgi:two-component system response regulator FixJ